MTIADNKLIYVTDPMCSWCYGFSPEISEVVEKVKDKCSLELVMGGLRPYNTETMKELGGFLSKHWHHVEERSGQTFNYTILEDHTFVYDTEPPARATVVVRHLKPEVEFAFFKKVQLAFYAENKNTNLLETYLPIAQQFEINKVQFAEAFESDAMKQAVRNDYEKAAEWGVAGFPTLIWKNEDQFKLLARGYTDASILIKQIELL